MERSLRSCRNHVRKANTREARNEQMEMIQTTTPNSEIKRAWCENRVIKYGENNQGKKPFISVSKYQGKAKGGYLSREKRFPTTSRFSGEFTFLFLYLCYINNSHTHFSCIFLVMMRDYELNSDELRCESHMNS